MPVSARPDSSCSRPRCGRSAAGWRIGSAARRFFRGCSAGGGFSWLLAWPSMVPFTVGALGCAVLMGLGNGAVFKLVPEHFPKETGTVTGLVGALGGLGGFFPPLLLGVFRDTFGVIWPGFALLSSTALSCDSRTSGCFTRETYLARSAFHSARTAMDRIRAGAWAMLVTLVAGRGDRRSARATCSTSTRRWSATPSRPSLRRSASPIAMRCGSAAADAAVLAAGLADVLRAPAPRRGTSRRLGQRVLTDSPRTASSSGAARLRGLAHWLIMWGCILAAAITFPLVWGWIHFETVPGDLEPYRTFLFGFPVRTFPSTRSSPSSSSTAWCGRRSW